MATRKALSRAALLLPVLFLLGCEPCSVVIGGHCQDRESNQDQDVDAPPTPLSAPLIPSPLGPQRGIRG